MPVSLMPVATLLNEPPGMSPISTPTPSAQIIAVGLLPDCWL
jgi:hypothetical protein